MTPRKSAGRTHAGRPRSARATHAPEAPRLPVAEPAAATRAAWALFAGLAVLVVMRALATFPSGMAAWGLDYVRFVPPVFGWPLLVLAGLALVPWVARPLMPLLDAVGNALAGAPGRSAAFAAIAAAVIVLAFPDQCRFVGDFLLRQGTVEESGRPGILFPQALPLDVFLHVTLPTWIYDHGWLDANGAARAIGAVDAGLLAIVSVMLARVLDLRGAAAVAVAGIAWWSGALSMYTGYSKAFGELALLSAAAAVFALRSLRSGAPPFGLGIVLAIALTLHRSALGLVPVWLVTWALWGRTHGRAGGWRRPATWIALAIPVAALGLLLPKIIATFLRWDSVHLNPAEVKVEGGPLRAAFAGRRPLDMANLLMVLAPAFPAALAALAAFGRGLPRRREALVLLVLVVPLTAVIPFIHPAQGFFRDWDDFASAAAALAVAGAWIAGEALRAAPRLAWLSLAVWLGAAVPSLQWLAAQHDLDRGLARVEALMTGPPRREGSEWTSGWDYLGIRNFRLERWDASARAFSQAAITSPSPRILLQWGIAESRKGDWDASLRVNKRLVARDPDNYAGWSAIAAAASQLTDLADAREAARQMDRIRPGDPNARRFSESIDDYLRQHPDFVLRAAGSDSSARPHGGR